MVTSCQVLATLLPLLCINIIWWSGSFGGAYSIYKGLKALFATSFYLERGVPSRPFGPVVGRQVPTNRVQLVDVQQVGCKKLGDHVQRLVPQEQRRVLCGYVVTLRPRRPWLTARVRLFVVHVLLADIVEHRHVRVWNGKNVWNAANGNENWRRGPNHQNYRSSSHLSAALCTLRPGAAGFWTLHQWSCTRKKSAIRSRCFQSPAKTCWSKRLKF